MIDPFPEPRPQPARIDFEERDVAILCEGRDDCAVLRHLAPKDQSPSVKIGTKSEGKGFSWEDEIEDLAVQVQTRKLAAVGFVFDAESDAERERKKLTTRCQRAGLVLPARALATKISKANGQNVRTGFLLNPHRMKQGSIETLFVPQIKVSKRWPCIRDLLACYQERDKIGQIEDKVIVRTFLAHSRSNTGLHVALQDRLLHCNGSEFDPIRTFLKKLGAV